MYYSTRQAMERLHELGYDWFSRQDISRMCKSKLIKAIRQGERGDWRIHEDDLQSFVQGLDGNRKERK